VKRRFLTVYALMMSAEGDLRWYVVWERRWRASDAAAFVSGGYDALSIVARAKTVRYPDLGFLSELTGLRELDVRARVADDSAAFDLIDLEGMLLATGCKVPFDGGRLRALRGLALFANRDLAGIAAMPWLREVTLVRWGGRDLALLGDKPELTYLRLDCLGQSVDPAALAACRELEDVHLNNGRLGELTPFSGHDQLRRLAAIGPKGPPSMDTPVSLSPLASLPSLRWIELIRQPPIESLAPLRAMPELQGIAFLGTTIVDGDLSPLLDLHPEAVVGPFRDEPHCSHTYNEIERLRAAAAER
jgi:hypothetical protein